MSDCGCGNQNVSGCQPRQITDESIASQLENLTAGLFGAITKTVDPNTGRAVWSPACTPFDNGIPGLPRAEGEGLLCYAIRLYNYLASQIGSITVKTYDQAAHGFVKGDFIYFNGTQWVKGIANALAPSNVVGMVDSVLGVNSFTLSTGGYVEGLAGLTPGEQYFLSTAVAGQMQTTDPSASGTVSKPVFVAISATEGIVQILRGHYNP